MFSRKLFPGDFDFSFHQKKEKQEFRGCIKAIAHPRRKYGAVYNQEKSLTLHKKKKWTNVNTLTCFIVN